MSNDLVKQPLTLLSACSYLIYKSFVSESFFVSIIGLLSVPALVFPIRRIGIYVAKRSQQLVVTGGGPEFGDHRVRAVTARNPCLQSRGFTGEAIR